MYESVCLQRKNTMYKHCQKKWGFSGHGYCIVPKIAFIETKNTYWTGWLYTIKGKNINSKFRKEYAFKNQILYVQGYLERMRL